MIEIMVALLLVTMITVAMLSAGGNSDTRMEEAMGIVGRALRFARSEATLRNSVIRLHFTLENLSEDDPPTLALEYGPNDHFIIPPIATANFEDFSESEREDAEEDLEQFNSKFKKVIEFQEKPYKFDNGIRIVGVGTSLTERMVTLGFADIYVYPTGERDGALIVFANDDSLGVVKVEPFTAKVSTEIVALKGEEDEEEIVKIVTEIFEDWLGQVDKGRQMRGFTLIEVMIATAIFAVFMTAFIAGQSGNFDRSLKMRNDAKLLSHSVEN